MDTNARLANRLIDQSIPNTTVFVPHDRVTEHRHSMVY